MKNLNTLVYVLAAAFTLLTACDDGGGSSNNSNNENNNNFTVLTYEDILDACLIRDACGVLGGGYIKPCVDYYYGTVNLHHEQPIHNDLFRCVLQSAGDCDLVEQCYGNGVTPAACDPNTQKGYCDGNIRYWCESLDRVMYAMDCAEAGYICVEGYDGNTACTPAACDDATYEPECDGSLMQGCDNGYINTTDCAALGLDCVKITDQEGISKLFCMGDGGSCDAETFVPSCEENSAVTCDQGVVTKVDCGSLAGNKVCVPPDPEIATDIPRCLAAGEECDTGDEYCLDSFVARICLDGTFFDVDCTELGFTRCTGSVPLDVGAHCTH